ncbi:hypothetical protein [Kribbella sp. NPDC051718]|uniref:hypothetical protein n=1 Tax=Kribbella sp. NPDC051718 TaxID=3155168 RepID=UPI00342A5E6B
MAKKQVDPLPQHTFEEVRAACEAPLPPGVTMVLLKKTASRSSSAPTVHGVSCLR